MFGAPQLYQINHLPTSRYFLEAGKLPCNKSLLGLIFFQVRIWCHRLSCFSAALLGNRAHFGGSEEKTKPKLFGLLPEEPEAWVLLINRSNCRHSSTGGSAHCPVRLANNFGRRDRQELRQWSWNTDRGPPYGYHRLSDSFVIKKLKKCGWSKSREALPLDEGYRQWMGAKRERRRNRFLWGQTPDRLFSPLWQTWKAIFFYLKGKSVFCQGIKIKKSLLRMNGWKKSLL